MLRVLAKSCFQVRSLSHSLYLCQCVWNYPLAVLQPWSVFSTPRRAQLRVPSRLAIASDVMIRMLRLQLLLLRRNWLVRTSSRHRIYLSSRGRCWSVHKRQNPGPQGSTKANNGPQASKFGTTRVHNGQQAPKFRSTRIHNGRQRIGNL